MPIVDASSNTNAVTSNDTSNTGTALSEHHHGLKRHDWPAFCTPPQSTWPATPSQPQLHFALTQFSVSDFAVAEFASQHIPLPSGIDQAVAKRQAEYLAGRLCAREALQALTGHALVPSRHEDRSPQWPPGITGAITHSHGIAAALVAPSTVYAGIGLDIEQHITDDKAQRLAEHILTAEEMRSWQDAWQDQPGPWLTRIFSLKEALFKALYPITGTRFYFQDAKLNHWDATTGEAQLTLLTDLSPQWHSGRKVSGHAIMPTPWPDYVFSRILIEPDEN